MHVYFDNLKLIMLSIENLDMIFFFCITNLILKLNIETWYFISNTDKIIYVLTQFDFNVTKVMAKL